MGPWSSKIQRCIQIFQGSLVTYLKWGDSVCFSLFCSLSLNAKVEELLKSDNICQSYPPKIEEEQFFMAHGVVPLVRNLVEDRWRGETFDKLRKWRNCRILWSWQAAEKSAKIFALRWKISLMHPSHAQRRRSVKIKFPQITTKKKILGERLCNAISTQTAREIRRKSSK